MLGIVTDLQSASGLDDRVEAMRHADGADVADNEFARQSEVTRQSLIAPLRPILGLTDGGILTGITIAEWDKGHAVVLSATGITRKPGAVTAYQQTEGKSSLVMTDDKPSGMTGSGRGRYTLATGSAAALAGKTYSYTFSMTGPNQFVVEVKHD